MTTDSRITLSVPEQFVVEHIGVQYIQNHQPVTLTAQTSPRYLTVHCQIWHISGRRSLAVIRALGLEESAPEEFEDEYFDESDMLQNRWKKKRRTLIVLGQRQDSTTLKIVKDTIRTRYDCIEYNEQLQRWQDEAEDDDAKSVAKMMVERITFSDASPSWNLVDKVTYPDGDALCVCTIVLIMGVPSRTILEDCRCEGAQCRVNTSIATTRICTTNSCRRSMLPAREQWQAISDKYDDKELFYISAPRVLPASL